jgi:hypothetical protein
MQQLCRPLYGEQAGVKNETVEESRWVARGWCLDKRFITKEKCEILLVMVVVRIWTNRYDRLIRILEARRRSCRDGPWLGLQILWAIFPSRVCDCGRIIIIIIIIYCNWAFHPVALVLTLVQTQQIRIKYTWTKQYKNIVQTIQKHSKYKYAYL